MDVCLSKYCYYITYKDVHIKIHVLFILESVTNVLYICWKNSYTIGVEFNMIYVKPFKWIYEGIRQ